jgi:hypothetical protein
MVLYFLMMNTKDYFITCTERTRKSCVKKTFPGFGGEGEGERIFYRQRRNPREFRGQGPLLQQWGTKAHILAR